MDDRPDDRPAGPRVATRNRTVALACAALVLSMVGASFAAVPFYDWFCRVTGYNGTTQVAASAPTRVIDRIFEIRFDANVAPGLDWSFRPATRNVTVRAGEVATVDYVIENHADRPISASATYNVTPDIAGAYFTKLVCFCFTEQTLGPRERVVVPVTFFVDPDADADKNLRFVRTITLSYTFFRNQTATPKPVAGLDARAPTAGPL